MLSNCFCNSCSSCTRRAANNYYMPWLGNFSCHAIQLEYLIYEFIQCTPKERLNTEVIGKDASMYHPSHPNFPSPSPKNGITFPHGRLINCPHWFESAIFPRTAKTTKNGMSAAKTGSCIFIISDCICM